MSPLCPEDLAASLEEVARLKYGADPGPTARLHRAHRYYSPDLFYEALCLTMVSPETDWLDVGGGRSPFPYNPVLATRLANTCRHLTTIDPGPNLPENHHAHVRIPLPLDAYRPEKLHDLATMRMVAEHIADPRVAVSALAAALRPGGIAVVYTVDALSPTVLLNRLLPPALRRAAMRRFGGVDSDIFPTPYLLNRRATLRRAMQAHGLDEVFFLRLDDCRASQPWLRLHAMELRLRAAVRRCGLPWPESCLLAGYRRRPDDAALPLTEHG
jgi:hypothetical protein